MSNPSVTVLLFGGARELLGADTVVVDIQHDETARSLLNTLANRFERLTPYLPSLRVAINGTYAMWDDPVRSGDEVAVIPPVAGG